LNVHSRSSDFIITAELTASDETGGGALSPDARQYTDPLKLNQSVNIQARTINGQEKSPLHSAIFAIPEKMAELRLTEIHFHPLDDNENNDREFEFLEIKNIGVAAIDLSLAGFSNGITYQFKSGTLFPPGQFIVLASNAEMFKRRYGFAPFDVYKGNLENAGERIIFANAAGDTIINVRFNDKAPWPENADGDGYSLVAVQVNPQGDPGDPAYWAHSYILHGSPGRDDNVAATVQGNQSLPLDYALEQNYPNPFNSSTTIRFVLPVPGQVKFEIFNLLGQRVCMLIDQHYAAGIHNVHWQADHYAGGLYFYRITAGEFTATKRLILMK
jgi:hypothetical protein